MFVNAVYPADSVTAAARAGRPVVAVAGDAVTRLRDRVSVPAATSDPARHISRAPPARSGRSASTACSSVGPTSTRTLVHRSDQGLLRCAAGALVVEQMRSAHGPRAGSGDADSASRARHGSTVNESSAMTSADRGRRSRGSGRLVRAGICVAVAVLGWFGYRATREWQRSSALLVERRADETADMLVTALARDMRGVQKSVLHACELGPASRWTRPTTLGDIVGQCLRTLSLSGIVLRVGRGRADAADVVFFSRANRPLVVAPMASGREPRFPSPSAGSRSSRSLVSSVSGRCDQGRRFSIFETDARRRAVSGHRAPAVSRCSAGAAGAGVRFHGQSARGSASSTSPSSPRQVAAHLRAPATASTSPCSTRAARSSPARDSPCGLADDRRAISAPVLRPAAGRARSARRPAAAPVDGAGQRCRRSAPPRPWSGADRTLVVAAAAAIARRSGSMLTARAVCATAPSWPRCGRTSSPRSRTS